MKTIKKAKLSVKLNGVKGGVPQWKDNMGYVACFLNDCKKHAIIVDAFQGAGDTYQRRPENEIVISNENGNIFSGTIDELIERLNH